MHAPVWCLPCGPASGRSAGFDEVDSTNTYVRDQARHGAPEGLVAVADHQTAGRGRLDRRWESPPGANLLASVLLRPACDGGDVHLCTGAVALAAADACREVAGVEPVLKWPNDLLVGGGQAGRGPGRGGVLPGRRRWPRSWSGSGSTWPGRGPRERGAPAWTTWRAPAQPVDRRRPPRPPAGGARRRGAPLLDDEAGRRALAEEVRRRCATLGQRVRVDPAGEELTGLAAGDRRRRAPGRRDGASGPARVSAGDVVAPAPGLTDAGPRASEGVPAGLILPHYAPSRHGRCRFHRVELRPLLGRAAPRGPCRRLRRAHLRRQPTQPVRHRGPDRLRPGRHLRPRRGREGAAGRGDRHDRPLRRRVAQLARRPEPRALLPDQRARDPDHARGGPPGRAWTASTTSRPARSTGTSRSTPTRSFTEDSPYRPRTPYNASKAGADHAVRAYAETYGLPDHDHQLREQLRPVPVPREADPALLRAGARRPAADALRQHREPPGVAARRTTTARPSTPCSPGAGWARPTTSAAAWRPPSWRWPTGSWPRSGKPESLKTIVPDRPGHDRRYVLDASKLRRELGWAPSVEWEQGLADTVALVRRAPGLVGAAAGPGARRRRGLGRHRRRLSACGSSSRGPTGSSAATSLDCLAGRVPAGGRRCALLGPEGPRPGLNHEVLATDIDTMRVDDRDAVLHTFADVPPRARAARRGLHRGRPVRDRGRRAPSPSTPSAPATSPRRPRRWARTWSTCRPTTSSTAPSTRPYREWDPPCPTSVYGASKLAGERECRPGLDHRAHELAVRRPRRQHGRHRAAAGRRRGRAALRRRPARVADVHRRPGARRSSRSGSTAGRASST